MKNQIIEIVCGATLLVATIVVVAVARQAESLPEVPVARTPAEVRVKAVERKAGLVERGEIAAAAGASCGWIGGDVDCDDRGKQR